MFTATVQTWWTILTTNKLFLAFIGGVASAARVDYLAFKTWTTYHDALAYDWGVALWRWFQGGVSGVIATVGLTGIEAVWTSM